MAKKLQLRRGTTSQHSSFTGAVGEVTVDTDKDVVVVHDGSQAGGFPMAKATDVSILDEDNFATNSATKAPSQQSVKAYVDTADALKANLAGPTFTGVPAAPTAAADTNTTQLATTAYVQTELGDFAPKASPALTGTATGVNLTLSGNLTVNGTTTTVATTNTTVTDNLLELNSGAGSNANDCGLIIERGSTGDNAIIAWDESADKFTVGTTAGTASSTGNITIAAAPFVASTVEDSKGNVRSIPQNSKTAAYTLVVGDAGKHIFTTTGTVTVPDSVFSAGDAVTIVNHSGTAITIAKGTNMYYSVDATNANRTLAGRGMATLLFTAADTCYISGAGLS